MQFLPFPFSLSLSLSFSVFLSLSLFLSFSLSFSVSSLSLWEVMMSTDTLSLPNFEAWRTRGNTETLVRLYYFKSNIHPCFFSIDRPYYNVYMYIERDELRIHVSYAQMDEKSEYMMFLKPFLGLHLPGRELLIVDALQEDGVLQLGSLWQRRFC